MPRAKAKPKVEDHTDLGQVLAAINGLNKGLETLAGRIDAVEGQVASQSKRIPEFKTTSGEDYKLSPNISKLEKGQSLMGSKQLPVGNDGLLLPRYKAGYDLDDRVRINPESEIGQAISRTGGTAPEEYVGTVVGFHFVDKNMVMKYRVDFPGLTRGKRGDGFRETDLLPV